MDDASERRWAFLAPKVGTTLSFVMALIQADVIRQHEAMAYLFAAAVTVAGGSTLVLMARGWYAHRSVLTGLIVQASLLIFNFAAIHHACGLIGAGDAAAPVGFSTALYFSIVTWTTLGYGDYAPIPALQLIAALEAAIGYVYLGLIVGIAASKFQQAAR